MKNVLSLADYRRRVADLYINLRKEANPEKAHAEFIHERNQLFAHHAQSALNIEQKTTFTGLEYFTYNPAFRFLVTPDYDVKPDLIDIQLRDDGVFQIRRVAELTLPFEQTEASLSLFWIEGYGGGLFLPFGDLTNSTSSYGGGRYLLDTIKHADLGEQDGKLILDFNFAYNPSCAYNSLWDCPLAPFENKLELAVHAGEKRF